MKTIQFFLTPAAGKRLIAKGIAARVEVRAALYSGTVALIAGTTNGYVAEELLTAVSQRTGFDRRTFYRGIIKPGSAAAAVPPRAEDIILVNGVWQRGKTIFDVAEGLGAGDIILKGANAVYLPGRQAAVLIGNPAGGTLAPISAAVVGRRARLILPVGVEKRVDTPLDRLSALCCSPETEGLRLWCAPGEPFTELDAIRQLSGAEACIFAGGGVCGDEGGCFFAATGTDTQLQVLHTLVHGLLTTPPYTLS